VYGNQLQERKDVSVDTRIGVVDLFCGIGGLSYGLRKTGLRILAGYDLDPTCAFAYETNNQARFIHKDIREVSGAEVSSFLDGQEVKVLAGCAPCQPFSSYAFKHKKKDPDKYALLYEFARLVKEVTPDIVTMENVPQLLSFRIKPVFPDFVSSLEQLGYSVSASKVYCPDYGIPQARTRLVLLASKYGAIELIQPTHTRNNYVTVRDVIADMPPIAAGEKDVSDPLHRSRSLSPLNLSRIRATPYGGSWSDWPNSLRLDCHKKSSGKSWCNVYGRMKWEEPAPTITTLCTGYGNGRFGHPTQDRAISIREAALLQTFPKEYCFFADEEHISISQASRYIGNAVPPKLGEVIGESIITHINKHLL
jgi:DNA (cytosine-5)-methyltransferase 1